MARTLLLAAAIVWLIAGAIGIGIGLMGAPGLQRILPPLVIDVAALGGAVVAVGFGVLAIGIVHVAVVVALRALQCFARSAALLLAITMTTLMLVLAAAAATSAVTVPDRALPFLIATAAALVAASVYGLVAGLLVVEVRTSRAP